MITLRSLSGLVVGAAVSLVLARGASAATIVNCIGEQSTITGEGGAAVVPASVARATRHASGRRLYGEQQRRKCGQGHGRTKSELCLERGESHGITQHHRHRSFRGARLRRGDHRSDVAGRLQKAGQRVSRAHPCAHDLRDDAAAGGLPLPGSFGTGDSLRDGRCEGRGARCGRGRQFGCQEANGDRPLRRRGTRVWQLLRAAMVTSARLATTRSPRMRTSVSRWACAARPVLVRGGMAARRGWRCWRRGDIGHGRRVRCGHRRHVGYGRHDGEHGRHDGEHGRPRPVRRGSAVGTAGAAGITTGTAGTTGTTTGSAGTGGDDRRRRGHERHDDRGQRYGHRRRRGGRDRRFGGRTGGSNEKSSGGRAAAGGAAGARSRVCSSRWRLALPAWAPSPSLARGDRLDLSAGLARRQSQSLRHTGAGRPWPLQQYWAGGRRSPPPRHPMGSPRR